MGISIIAGICFLLAGSEVLYNLFRGSYSSIFSTVIDDLNGGYYSYLPVDIISMLSRLIAIVPYICMIAVGILLLRKKYQTASTVMVGAGIFRIVGIFLSALFMLMSNNNDLFFLLLTRSYIWGILTAIGWILLGMMKNKDSSVSRLWFLPAVLFLLYIIVPPVINHASFSFYIIFEVFLLAAFFLYGYAVSRGDLEISVQQAGSATVKARQVQQQVNNYSAAEELKMYYSLFKDGVITEEEYKTKREEILNR